MRSMERFTGKRHVRVVISETMISIIESIPGLRQTEKLADSASTKIPITGGSNLKRDFVIRQIMVVRAFRAPIALRYVRTCPYASCVHPNRSEYQKRMFEPTSALQIGQVISVLHECRLQTLYGGAIDGIRNHRS